MRLAYLCNLYPAVSHSFVRREIEAVVRAGHEVHRFSLRPARGDLKDQQDLREAERTEAVLAEGFMRLGLCALGLLLTRPARSLQALAAAWRLSAPGLESMFRHLAYWLEAAWLVRRMAELQVEHLHAHFGTNPASVAALARAWGGPPFSFTAHGPDEFDAPLTLSLPAKIEAASFVVAISSYGRSQLMRWSDPQHWGKIRVVGCGLDAAFLEASVEPIPEGSPEFVCVARLSAQKGLPLLIAACDQLRQAGERFTLTIIGDGELRESLEEDIRFRELGSFVFLAGTCSSAEIRDHLRRSRAFVLPSFAEGLPVVIMEALALGRPVISTAIAGIPELVDDTCGWLIPAGSEEALVEKMSAALHATAGDLAAKGATGRERVKRLHDAERNAGSILEAIRSTRSDASFGLSD
ncbi:glycosyltransferase [Sphingomonas sp.]|uniref:glycosyltransferase n=1 Tax=Sphingomonas sp. TaxID=28214 RepID=UPI00389D9EA1